MKKNVVLLWFVLLFIGQSQLVRAHCDTRNGPVVTAARDALRTGNVDLVLIWVQPADEAALKAAFRKSMAVRTKGMEAQNLADEYFFETTVRLHRMGEGEPYSGLKDEPPADYVLLAEKALKQRSADSLLLDLGARIREPLHHQLSAAVSAAMYPPGNIKAGREYVARYVRFLHYVEALYAAARNQPVSHAKHESAMLPPGAAATTGMAVADTADVNRSYYFLLVASLVVLSLLMIPVFLSQKRRRKIPLP